MANAFRNKHFVARLCDNLFFVNGEIEPSFHHGHQLVRRVDEIIPFPAGRVGEQAAGIAPLAPVMRDLVAVERHWKFLMCEVRHGANVIVSGLGIQQMSTESMVFQKRAYRYTSFRSPIFTMSFLS